MDVQHTNGWIQVREGILLYYQAWSSSTAQTPLIIVHGGGEHIGRYQETAMRLAQDGLAVFACDLEGHGRSPGVRGHIPSFDHYVADVNALVHFVSTKYAGQRPIVLGHSLGGLISTWYAVEYPEAICALVLTSPAWGLSLAVPRWKRLIAHVLSVLWPSMTMKRARQPAAFLSHDPRIADAYLSDPLTHVVASARMYTEVQQRMRQLPEALPRLHVPVLVLQAGDDHIASAETVTRLFPLVGSPQKRLIIYDGYYHEVLNEVGKARVMQDMFDWLHSILPQLPST